MNKKLLLTAGLLATFSVNSGVFAASPLPQFEKEAIEDTYRRTGDMEPKVESKNDGLSQEHLGNTGTKENPAFYVKKINLTGEKIEDKFGELQGILARYEHKSLDIEAMRQLQADVTKFVRDRGYTVCQAVIPPQEIQKGELEVKIYVAKYDTVTRVPIPEEEKEKRTDVADRVLDHYVSQIKPGETIRDSRLEKTLNRLNDLPGVQARAGLKPGTKAGTTSLELYVERRPVWNNYVFVDNAGSKSTGRYRYGFYTEVNNPGHNGDKIGVSGMTSNGDLFGGSVRYEAPVGYRGTRMGVAVSLTDYDSVDSEFGGFANTKGRSMGASYYGYTPLYRDKRARVHLTWGYDYRKLKDEYTGGYKDAMEAAFGSLLPNGKLQKQKRHSNVLHMGFNGSEYEKNRFTSYGATWWWGNVTGEQNYLGGRTTDNEGSFHKGTGEFTHIIFDGKTNYRVNMNAQIANHNLDTSERFYIGGMNSVRAYNGSTFAGDNGLYWCTEIRRNIGIEGLEAAIFYEAADASIEGDSGKHRTLQGWGLGLRYRKDNDWHAQLDYARKVRHETDIDTKNDWGRIWFQIYKMF